MGAERIHVTFEGPEVEEHGVPVEDLRRTFNHLQRAFSSMVGYLTDAMTSTGQPKAWIRRASTLRLINTSPGSLTAELGVSRPVSYGRSIEDESKEAIDLIMRWDPEEGDSLPDPVARELSSIGTDLSYEVAYVRLWHPDNDRHVNIQRKEKYPEMRREMATEVDMAPGTGTVLHGRLQEVDWDQRTARLDRYRNRPVQLRFDASLDEEMHRFARQHVEVRGRGHFNSKDQWASVEVQEISGTGLTGEPFDLEAFWNNPNPKVFDPDKIIRASEPFDVDEFMRFIRSIREDRSV